MGSTLTNNQLQLLSHFDLFSSSEDLRPILTTDYIRERYGKLGIEDLQFLIANEYIEGSIPPSDSRFQWRTTYKGRKELKKIWV
jgi:hypothetical protein